MESFGRTAWSARNNVSHDSMGVHRILLECHGSAFFTFATFLHFLNFVIEDAPSTLKKSEEQETLRQLLFHK